MRKLEVRATRSPGDSIVVGTLAERERRIYFEYAPEFAASGLELSPFRLPLQPGLVEHRDVTFGPLPGLFDDSLPDGWGLLLMDRQILGRGLDPAAVSPLERLAYLGSRTMGALTYHPPLEREHHGGLLDLHALGRNAERVLAGEADAVLPQLLEAGGSPAGARPKVLVGIKGDQVVSGEGELPEGFEPWLVKFSAKQDSRDAGSIEYAYALMARAAGIPMPEVRLLHLEHRRSPRDYFAVRRFDRASGNRRSHVHTLGNLLHANFRIPSTDYSHLLKVTRSLTRNNEDLLDAVRRMVFNVAVHNRDDHAKNFAFTMDWMGEWSLSPAYDLTYAAGPGGEHSMAILGEGRRPSGEHCLELAEQFGVKRREAARILEEVNAAVARWPEFSDQSGCSKAVRTRIGRALIRLA